MAPSIRSAVGSLVVASSLLLGAPALHAQGNAPDKQTVDEAKKHFFAGEKAQEAGDYDTAIAEYEKAYDLLPTPEFLYNLGQVHRLRGDKAVALQYYKRYLEEQPNGVVAPTAREFVDTLSRQIAYEESHKTEEPPPSPTEVKSESSSQSEANSESNSESSSMAVVEVNVHSKHDPGSKPMRIVGLSLAGVGVVALGLGVKFALDAKSLESDAEDATAFDPQLDDDGKAANRNMFISLTVGGAAVIAGGVLYILGRPSGEEIEPTVSVAPSATSDSIGFAVSGRF